MNVNMDKSGDTWTSHPFAFPIFPNDLQCFRNRANNIANSHHSAANITKK